MDQTVTSLSGLRPAIHDRVREEAEGVTTGLIRLEEAVIDYLADAFDNIEQAADDTEAAVAVERRRQSMNIGDLCDWKEELTRLDEEYLAILEAHDKISQAASQRRTERKHLLDAAETRLSMLNDKIRLMQGFSGLKWVDGSHDGPTDAGYCRLRLVDAVSMRAAPSVVSIRLSEAEWAASGNENTLLTAEWDAEKLQRAEVLWSNIAREA